MAQLPPILRGLFWPLGNLVALASLPPTPAKGFGSDGSVPPATHFSGKAIADTPMDHVGVQLSTLPKLALAVLVWALFSGGSSWAASAEALDREWMALIFTRDMIITWLIAGGWEFVVYSQYSPFSARLRGHKLNPDMPSARADRWPFANQHAHDCFWSCCSTLISSAMEIAVAHAWATGCAALPPSGAAPGDAWWRDATTICWLATMPYWRLAHFFVVHRSMHKWFPGRAPGTGWCPDVGAALYSWVHSLHHKSKNPTSWSGISMHPMESSIYYTAMLFPLVFAGLCGFAGVHPIVLLYTKMDLTIAALVGHDGYGYPGAASQAHWLHHNNFDCNYGEVSCSRNPTDPPPNRTDPPPLAELRSLRLALWLVGKGRG